jgi:hypothetical protein
MHLRVEMMAVATALLLAAGAARAEPPAVGVELNKLEAAEGACRAYLVLQNRGSETFTSLKLDLVMFDADGIVARRLAVEGAPLPAGKTSLKVFDVADIGCPKIGRVLLNDVLACAGAGGPVDNCLARIEPSARGRVPFVK